MTKEQREALLKYGTDVDRLNLRIEDLEAENARLRNLAGVADPQQQKLGE